MPKLQQMMAKVDITEIKQNMHIYTHFCALGDLNKRRKTDKKGLNGGQKHKIATIDAMRSHWST